MVKMYVKLVIKTDLVKYNKSAKAPVQVVIKLKSLGIESLLL